MVAGEVEAGEGAWLGRAATPPGSDRRCSRPPPAPPEPTLPPLSPATQTGTSVSWIQGWHNAGVMVEGWVTVKVAGRMGDGGRMDDEG